MIFKINKRFNLRKFLREARKYDEFEVKKYEGITSYFIESAKMVNQKKLGLKLVIISDTHGDLAFGNRFQDFMSRIKEYDLCMILGDIYVYELDRILKIIPKEKVIALRGNHDCFDLYEKYGIYNINGKMIKYKGIRIAGIEGSFKYKKAEFPSYTHFESLYLAEQMPKKADILLSHDCMFVKSKYDIAHSGLAGITYYVFKNAVKWHIHGHVHKSYQKDYTNGTREKSVYGCEYIEI